MRKLSWLHVSDFHYDVKQEMPQMKAFDALLLDIKNRAEIDPSLSEIDFIAITGDLGLYGTKDEYDLFAEHILIPLSSYTKKGLESVYIVPGNHDLNRALINEIIKRLPNIITDEDIVAQILAKEDERTLCLKKLENYINFYGEHFPKNKLIDNLYSVSTFSKLGSNISILGLNSTWAGYGGDLDNKKLIIGTKQASDALSLARTSDVIIALTHHPFDYLSEFEYETEFLLRKKCSFILCGHRHVPDIIKEKTSSTGEVTIIQAGSAYKRGKFPDGYNYVNIDLETKEGMVFSRVYDETTDCWISDTNYIPPRFAGKYPIKMPDKAGPSPYVYIKYNSFELLQTASLNAASANADVFYNGFPPTWGDIQNNYDFARDLYIEKGGIKETVTKWLNESSFPSLLLILGTEGNGKTTLLRRAAFEFHHAGFIVLRQKANALINFEELKDFCQRNTGASILIVDELLNSFKDSREIGDFVSELNTVGLRLLIVGTEQLNRWSFLASRITPRFKFSATYVLTYLSKREQLLCINKLEELEAEGLLTKKVELSLSDKLTRFKNKWADQLLVALLELRYDGSFEQIIIKEFNDIPEERTKWLYGSVCYLNSLGLKTSSKFMRKAFDISSSLNELNKFAQSKAGILLENDNEYHARHRLIAYVIKKYLYKEKTICIEAITKILNNIDFGNLSERSLFLDLFGEKSLYRSFMKPFNKEDIAQLRDFFENIRSFIPKEYKKYIFLTEAQTERKFKFYPQAEKCFISAINLDPEYSFSYRQYAWLKREMGASDPSQFDAAVGLAKKACKIDPTNVINNYHCGLILKMNRLKYLDESIVYLKKASDLDPFDDNIKRAIESYNDYKRCLASFSMLNKEDIIPSYIMESCGATYKDLNLFYSERHSLIIKAYSRYLTRLANQDELDAQDDVLSDESLYDSANPRTRSLRLACLARAHYNHLEEDPIPPETIEKLLTESLKLDKNNSYAHNWLGTFLKEIKKDFSGAEKEYQIAINIAKTNPNPRYQNNSLFLNNLALLIMDEVQIDRRGPDDLSLAKEMLELAVQNMENQKWSIPWPKINLDTLNRMIEERST